MRVDQIVKMVSGDRQHRLAVHLGIVQTVEEVNAARPGRSQADTEPAGVFGVGARHKRGRFFMADLDEPNTILPSAERFHDAVDAVAGQTEHDFDTPALDRVNENIAPCPGHG